jgi:hypothetical protein
MPSALFGADRAEIPALLWRFAENGKERWKR